MSVSVSDEQIAAFVKRASTYGVPFVGLLNPGDTPSDFSKRFTAEILALCTSQAGVPDDIVKDAQRYRWLRDNGGDWAVCSWGEDDGGAWFRDSRPPTVVDRAIDAAMLAAAPKEGGNAPD